MKRWQHAGIALAVLMVVTAQCGTTHGAGHGRSAGAAATEAFALVYRVLQHPRCVNCHPSGRVPLQGDEGRPHGQNVQGGGDGKGVFAMKCANCHLAANGAGANTPPGAPHWQLPAANMPLVFQGRSPAELARQLVDPAQNGGRTAAQLLEHVTADPLVLWGWNPDEGRRPVPVPHGEFVAAMRAWIDAGCPVPE
jgi:hypothetical protein